MKRPTITTPGYLRSVWRKPSYSTRLARQQGSLRGLRAGWIKAGAQEKRS